MAPWLHRLSFSDACSGFYSRLRRTKPVGSMAAGSDDLTELPEGSAVGLAKVLTTVDLVSLGVGSCVGTGMYVVAGLVAKAMAGPGVILSFIIAAAASVLSGDLQLWSLSPRLSLTCLCDGGFQACVTQSLACGSQRQPAPLTPTAT